MAFDACRPETWESDIYTGRIPSTFHASKEAISFDVLSAQSLGITNWSQSDTDLADAQAQLGRDAAEASATAARLQQDAKVRACDCAGRGCAKCSNDGFYRPEVRGSVASGVVDYDAMVAREEGWYVIVPQSIRAREWFSVHYAEKQTASGRFLFNEQDTETMGVRAREEGLSFGKGY